MKNIGISTVYTGYNYGSALQAFAGKMICKVLGYNGVVLHLGGSLIPGRDVRMVKLLTIGYRMVKHPIKVKKSVKAYAAGIATSIPKESQRLFDAFIEAYICPMVTNWRGLKCLGKQKEYAAFVCGSDQIWNGDVLYVDPQYYLRYAPSYKRIAFAPSFGRFDVAEYNKKIMGKYIREIPYLSVREQSGISVIRRIAEQDAVCLLDPTLFFTRQEWGEYLNLDLQLKNAKRYLLAYFLDEPSEQAKTCIKKIAWEYKLQIVAMPYGRGDYDWFDTEYAAGPIEFVDAVANAAFVCTDSFHGTAFSLIMQVPFYTFERQYGVAAKQSARIVSLLDLVNLSERYQPSVHSLDMAVDFGTCEKTLNRERDRTKKYLLSAIEDIVNRSGGI